LFDLTNNHSETPEGHSCLTLDTLIETPNGFVNIGSMKNGDEVVTVNPTTHEKTNTTIHSYFQKQAKVYEVQLQGSYKINATGDHPILTRKGWKNTEDLDLKKDEVYVTFQQTEYFHNVLSPKVIFNDTKKLEKVNIKKSLIRMHTKFMMSNDLYPLSNNNPKLPILARMLGYIMTDGSMTIYKNSPIISMCFGQHKDAEEFNSDMISIGHKASKIKKVTTSYKSKDDRDIVQTTYRTQYWGFVPSLFLMLGCPHGRKTKASYCIPDWIMDGSELVKKEFLAGFQGGDGGCIRTSGRKNRMVKSFAMVSTTQHKIEKHLESVKKMMNQLKALFSHFGIETLDLKISKEDSDYYCIVLPFSDALVNLRNYMKRIGYRYCNQKTEKGKKYYFYLDYKIYHWKKEIERKKYVHNLLDLYYSGIKEVDLDFMMKKTGFSKTRLLNFRMNSDIEKTTKPPMNILLVDEFIKTQYDKKGCFLPLYKITPLGETTVADFTTESTNHSFIANGIVTHNCGLVKNLALLCRVTTGSRTHLVYEWLKENVNFIRVSDLSVGNDQGVIYGWKIFVNGKWVGISPEATTEKTSFDSNGNPNSFPDWVHAFREARSRGEKIDVEVSISTYSSDRKEIYIFTDEGRFCRPLLVVDRKTGQLGLTPNHIKKVKKYLNPESPPGDEWSWQDLVENHIIEYIDVAESESPMIATFFSDLKKNSSKSATSTKQISTPLKIPYTHAEIHPSMMLGVLASLISFPDCSQAPRNTYQSGKFFHSFSCYL
jgi:intein/homing endonuclease